MLKWFEKLSTKELQELLAKNKYDYFIDNDNNIYKKLYKINNQTLFEVANLSYKDDYFTRLYNSEDFIKSDDNPITRLNLLTYDKLMTLLIYSFDNMNTSDVAYSIAKKFYGNDNVELLKEENTLIIYQPILRIISENGLEHDMKDVYIRLNVYDENFKLEALYRGTVTSSECRANYKFSHCSDSFYEPSWIFCYGYTDTSMNRYFYKRRNKKEFILSMEYLLHLLNAYLTWESVSGVPYREIAKIKRDVGYFYETRASFSYLNYKQLQKYSDVIINQLTSINYRYSSLDKIKLQNSTRSEIRELSKQFDDIKRIIVNNKECKVKPECTYDYYKKRYEGRDLLTFKGQNVTLKIENTDPEVIYTTGLTNEQFEQLIDHIEEKIKFILWQKHQEQLILTQLEN